jgi:hypothetical protein
LPGYQKEETTMTEATIAAPAPAAAPISPASTGQAAPTPAPAAAPASSPSAPSFGGSVPTSKVDPGKFPIREDYAAALLKEKLAAIPAVEEQPTVIDELVAVVDSATELVMDEAPASVAVTDTDSVTKEAPAVTEEEDFQLEPEAIVTPEVLSQMVTDTPEFG